MRPWVRWGFPFGGFSVDWRIRQLDRSETPTAGICPAISGAAQYSPCFECSDPARAKPAPFSRHLAHGAVFGASQEPLWRSHTLSRPPTRQRGGESIFLALDVTFKLKSALLRRWKIGESP